MGEKMDTTDPRFLVVDLALAFQRWARGSSYAVKPPSVRGEGELAISRSPLTPAVFV